MGLAVRQMDSTVCWKVCEHWHSRDLARLLLYHGNMEDLSPVHTEAHAPLLLFGLIRDEFENISLTSRE